MLKRLGILFFLTGFLVFSISGTIFAVGKMKSQQIAELFGSIAEEEDETGREDGADTEEALFQIIEHVSAYFIQIEQHYFPQPIDPLPDQCTNTVTPPPRA